MKKEHIILVLFAVSLTSCGNYDALLEDALSKAKTNRAELELVLNHYSEDSLKLEAAKFLIRNMPGHYSYADTARINRYYNSVDSMFDNFHGQPIDSIRLEIDGLARVWGVERIPKVMDVEVVSADFLIRNIDEAFKQWEDSPWCSHLTFDEFCEYILPYKSEELQPFDNWREEFRDLCTEELPNLRYADLFRHSSFRAATLVRDALVQKYRPSLMESVRHMVYRPSTRLRIPFGMCEDYVSRTNTIFRSIGIPIVMEFTPQWSYGDNAHDWNVVLTRKGWEVPFSGMFSSPGEQHKPFENMPKAYRRTYARNPLLVELNEKERYVPVLFRNVFLKDVTANHTSVVSLSLPIHSDEADGFVYLAVSSSGGRWEPVAVGRVENGKASFQQVGRESIYIPVRYDSDGVQRTIGMPVRVEATGKTTQLHPDEKQATEVVLHRKYPVLEYVYVQAAKMIGGEFQAASTPDFSDAVTIASIDNANSNGVNISVPDSIGAFRYWRYVNNREWTNSSIAEIAFLGSDGTKVTGRIISSAPQGGNPANAPANAFDGKLLTCFNSAESKGGWVGMDFGAPERVSKIRYYARGDGNSIEPGDFYELSYWSADGGWKSVGRKVADDVSLTFTSVPANALLLLRDRTKGSNEHVFVYENGEQKWW